MSSVATVRRLSTVRPRSEMLLDAGIAAAALAGSLALLSHGSFAPSRPGYGEPRLVGVLLAAASTVPLLAWRRSPLAVFAVTAAACVLLAGLGYPADPIIGPTAALYLLAASREPAHPWTWRTTIAVLALLAAYLGATAAAQDAFPRVELQHAALGWAVAWFAGERTRLRRAQVAELRERALAAERDAERERLLAVAEERARIARDLHDSAGHAISVIAVRAGAARLRHHQDPGRSLAALEAVEELARRTVTEIDHLVGALRDNGSASQAVEPPPGLASLQTLIAYHEAAGLDVTLGTTGTPGRLDGPADRATYRVFQEALTNAARHGSGSARIDLAFGEAAVELTVTNPVAAGGERRRGGGHGLVGMRERAALVGGSLDVERAGGTFRVRARIPYGVHRP